MTANEEVTAAIEEYLECIYKLQERSNVARTSDIVKALKVAPGTVTNTVEWLEKQNLVTHTPYKGVKLTQKGKKIALQVIRKHRLSERLLVDILHMDKDRAHDAACKLEHSMTDEMITRLEETLKYPKTCPHGNPIPTEKGEIIEEFSLPLLELVVGEQCTIVKITEETSDLLHYLDKLGLVPKAVIKVQEKAPFDGPITVKVGSTDHAVSRAVAAIIQVKRTK
ncbi:MAG: metal-dependent transcriptional regulator [Candidatus Bathyarchaeota archaeon]|nr:metal-dependent transcriptional regulator [Candidatus Bathyarchaeota archaeon]